MISALAPSDFPFSMALRRSFDVLSLNLNHTEQSGFLATSYNSVFTPSGEYSEELPDSRSRTALHMPLPTISRSK